MNIPSPARRVTIYDLAEQLGTSASAVSAVLNGSWRKRRISRALADRIEAAADAAGYAVNLQAAGLRRERSRIVGMILPKYDNRYFGAIAERFEAMARARDLFPIITCTMRDPELEAQAARNMVSHQVEWLVATGATDPDRVADLCAAAGVRTFNLDLPGTRAPSVITDNFTGARDLARLLLQDCQSATGVAEPLLFIGGRGRDHNTLERLRGFRAAHEERGLPVPSELIQTCGYAADKVEGALDGLHARRSGLPHGAFVNSTISLEGVMHWLRRADRQPSPIRLGCFDFDPFAVLLPETVAMVGQDVDGLLQALFRLTDAPVAVGEATPVILVPAVGPLRHLLPGQAG